MTIEETPPETPISQEKTYSTLEEKVSQETQDLATYINKETEKLWTDITNKLNAFNEYYGDETYEFLREQLNDEARRLLRFDQF